MATPNYSPELSCQKLAISAGSIQSCSPLSGTIIGLMSLMFLSVVMVLSIDCFLLLRASQSKMRQNVLQLSNFLTSPGCVWYELHQHWKCPFCWGITVVSNLDWLDNLAWIFSAGDISHRNCDYWYIYPWKNKLSYKQRGPKANSYYLEDDTVRMWSQKGHKPQEQSARNTSHIQITVWLMYLMANKLQSVMERINTFIL